MSPTAGLVSFLLSNLERVGRLGFTPLTTVVGTLALLNPMKRLIAASGWTRVADQTRQHPPSRGVLAGLHQLQPSFSSPSSTLLRASVQKPTASGHMTSVESRLCRFGFTSP